MKVAACLFFVAFLTSCCFTSQKCDSETYVSPAFRILNANDEDLLFGAGKVYDISSIKCYTLTGGDTVFYNCVAGTASSYPYDSVLYAGFGYQQEQPATVYMMLDSTDVDTLGITYQTHTTKCCGSSTSISSYKCNGTTLNTNNSGVTIIRK